MSPREGRRARHSERALERAKHSERSLERARNPERGLARVAEQRPVVPKPDPPMLEAVPEAVRTPSRRRRIAKIVGGLALLAVAVPLGLWIYYGFVYVVTQNAVVKGRITQVGSELAGVVTSVEVDEGQRVKAGQILARFEDHQLQANQARASSQLLKVTRELEVERLAIEQEFRRLDGTVVEASAHSDAARAQVDAAVNQAEAAQTKYEQLKTLAASGAIAQQDLRDAETVRRAAEAQASNARAAYTAAKAAEQLAIVEFDGLSVRRRAVSVLESQVEAAKADLSIADADLRAAVIRAPADGWVVRRMAEAGSSVTVGQPLVALWIGKDIWVEAWVEEGDLSAVAPGRPARVTVKPFPGRVFVGAVESVGASTDAVVPDPSVPQPAATRLRSAPVVCVRIRLQNAGELFPGLSAIVGIRKVGL